MRIIGSVESYKCFNDCSQMGCPGHTIQMIYDTVSDIYYTIDEKQQTNYYDRNQLKALFESYGNVEF